MKVDRSRDRPARHLEWRVRLLGVGAVVALAGIYFDSSWMVNAAIVILLIGFAVRFAPAPAGAGQDDLQAGGATDAEPGRGPEPPDASDRA
ncbi:MAG: hypothetical protein HKN71_05030 [Gemmatimonadetes bacterium]|nr:hypothetical protein [Gemmatimonadota bacterium]